MFEGMGPKNLKADLFICTCALQNNIETMFRKGTDECFYYGNFDLGLTLLRQAADEDHLEAIYLLGRIYISRGSHQCDDVTPQNQERRKRSGAEDVMYSITTQ
uniref:At2g35280-like TPR domain-containing protein n=1 Tax=Lactuca sativa TaxID=4236 RepID=A0A9R1WUC9_LACSA|nr:hypothetical protein LSAT_V11C900486380 [Lactuca sativa]